MVTVIADIIIPYFSETRIFGIAFRTVHIGTAICKRFQIYEKDYKTPRRPDLKDGRFFANKS
jgi:hypothetical protein